MKNFRTFECAVEFYRLSCKLCIPATLKAQLMRAAASVPLNLAEGRGKKSVKDQVRFFIIAMGSLRECQAILILAEAEGTPAWKALDKAGAHLYKLIKEARG